MTNTTRATVGTHPSRGLDRAEETIPPLLLAARRLEAAGRQREASDRLRLAASQLIEAADHLQANAEAPTVYIVPEDPASLIDTECCQ